MTNSQLSLKLCCRPWHPAAHQTLLHTHHNPIRLAFRTNAVLLVTLWYPDINLSPLAGYVFLTELSRNALTALHSAESLVVFKLDLLHPSLFLQKEQTQVKGFTHQARSWARRLSAGRPDSDRWCLFPSGSAPSAPRPPGWRPGPWSCPPCGPSEAWTAHQSGSSTRRWGWSGRTRRLIKKKGGRETCS